MSTIVPSSLTPTASAVLEFLAVSGGESSASTAAIADAVGAGVTAVKDALRALEDVQLVVVDRRRRNWHSGDPTGRTLRLSGDAA